LTAEYIPHAALSFGMGLVYEPELISVEAKEMAAKADVVVVCVGSGRRPSRRAATAPSICPGDKTSW